jgi:RHS repeat-associated protein
VTNAEGAVCQHIQYLPFGELFVSQMNRDFDSRYKFTAKELDNETSYTYFGARYYDSDMSVWLSVDPMSDKYPGLSPYIYCLNNPVKLIDQNGMDTILPDATGKNFYLPDNVNNVQYYNNDYISSGQKVYEGGVKSFNINKITYNAKFDNKTGVFCGYINKNGDIYNQLNHLPSIINKNFDKSNLPDLISFSANIESILVKGANVSLNINILLIDNKIDVFYTRNEAYSNGFGIDWGINYLEAWYVGKKNKSSLTRNDVLGDFSYWQISLPYNIGMGKYKGYDNNGNIIWEGNIFGVGFSFGGSFGKGKTLQIK